MRRTRDYTPLHAALWRLLDAHARGADRAIRTADIGLILRVDERVVRQLAAELVRCHGRPIGSSTGRPPGLYVIVTAAERAAVIKQLEGRLRETYRRLKAFKDVTARELVSQLELDLG